MRNATAALLLALCIPVTSRAPPDTPLANLHLTLMQMFGDPSDSFNGVSTGALNLG
jgi:hypothetical protein